MASKKFFICKHCGNIIGMIESAGVPVVCCGEKMTELVPNTTDAAQEKHVPDVTVSGNTVTVKIGSIAHPMTQEHFISWVYVETAQGGQRKKINPGDMPEVVFALTEKDKPIAAYAYCNLHGLWKKDL
ncbi:desulfoferrodoxin [Treponema parvum]|uniref:Desulfoferrodoxin n=1 Tax=Treponema parvum TaxID=138851 RepID=A0A975F5A6_9SPIR|nr:desulfoferrodoxin family protein [Treponema parvum]QTQ14751.1 desulfoferrodoxin [Treponema parvum]